MDKDVTIWNVGLGVMSIGYTDNRNRSVCERQSWNRFMPTVKHLCEEDARPGPESLPRSWSLSMKESVKTGHDWNPEKSISQ